MSLSSTCIHDRNDNDDEKGNDDDDDDGFVGRKNCELAEFRKVSMQSNIKFG